MLEIAYCLDNLSIGGTELNAVRTAERLDPSRFALRVIALSGDGPLRSRFERAGIPIHVVPIRSLGSPHAFRQGVHLARYVRSHGVDIVHAHDTYTNVLAVPFARMARVPAVIASRRWWFGLDRRHALANRIAYRFAHRVIANSGRVAELLQDEGVAPRRIAVVPNFLESEAFEDPTPSWLAAARGEIDVEEGLPVIGTVSRLDPIKNLSSLLRASRALADAGLPHRLVIVGDGPHREVLEREASELGLAWVRFLGQRPARPSFHYLFDVSVLTSLSEGFPNTLLEAMAAARPVVATRVGGVPDVIDDGEVGWLVPPSDDAALADALQRVLADPERGRRMGAAGRSRARRDHHEGRVIEQLSALYESLIPGRSTAAPARAAATADRSLAAGAD